MSENGAYGLRITSNAWKPYLMKINTKVSSKKYFTAIDLFCGAGGLTHGLKKAGFKVIAGVEIHLPAIKTYRLNNKSHVLYETDIRLLEPKKIMTDLGIGYGELDLLAGCPPCQGFSSHRTRNKTSAVDDPRNELIFEYLRFVKAMFPKVVMLENVPGLAKDTRMDTLIKELKLLGYKFDSNTLSVKDVSDYGVPQRRKRMILQASRYGLIESPTMVSKKKTVRSAISKLPPAGFSNDYWHDLSFKRTPKVEKIINLVPKDGGSRKDIPIEYWLDCHKKNPHSYTDVYGRMAWDSVSPTITGGCNNPSKGRFLHPEEDRGITLREAALLQTFPKKYKFTLDASKDDVALMIGNALPPVFIKKHAKKIFDHLETIS